MRLALVQHGEKNIDGDVIDAGQERAIQEKIIEANTDPDVVEINRKMAEEKERQERKQREEEERQRAERESAERERKEQLLESIKSVMIFLIVMIVTLTLAYISLPT